MMTSNDWLKQAEAQLKASGIGTARLDALILLEDVTSMDRAKLLAEPTHPITAAQQTKLTKLLNRRATHEPLAYIRGFTEFYGRNFVITAAVLEPRPESETMIDLLKQLFRTPPPTLQQQLEASRAVRIADVGTGSGALGITAKLELPGAQIDLLEIDQKALMIAQINVDKFTLELPVVKSDLLSQSPSTYHILLCNLPYVPDSYQINQAAAQEPGIAIFGGPDGLRLYDKLFQQAAESASPPLFILTESLPSQHVTLADLARQHGYLQQREDDFIQLFSH